MPPRTPARAHCRRAVFAVLAAAIVAGVGLATPAAASPEFTPVTRPIVTITPGDQLSTFDETIHVVITATTGDGGPLDGSVKTDWSGPDGFQVTHPAATYAHGSDVSRRPSGAGTQTIKATYVPNGLGSTVSATATYTVKYGGATATATVGPATTGAKTPVALVVYLSQGASGAGGTLYVKANPGGPTASCTPALQNATTAGCIATLPAGMKAGAYTLGVTYAGSPLYMDYYNGISTPIGLTVTASPTSPPSSTGSTKSSGSGGGTSGGTSASPSPSAAVSTPSASDTPTASIGAIVADPTSSNSRGGTDPLLLVITTVGACAALGALGVAIYLLIKRRRSTGA